MGLRCGEKHPQYTWLYLLTSDSTILPQLYGKYLKIPILRSLLTWHHLCVKSYSGHNLKHTTSFINSLWSSSSFWGRSSRSSTCCCGSSSLSCHFNRSISNSNFHSKRGHREKDTSCRRTGRKRTCRRRRYRGSSCRKEGEKDVCIRWRCSESCWPCEKGGWEAADIYLHHLQNANAT